MARVWVEDRAGHTAYVQAAAKAKRAGRTPPGRWRLRWYGPDGSPKMKTFSRRVDADAERSRLEARLGDGSYRDPAAARAKFSEIAEAWLAAQAHLKRSTRNRYRGMLDLHILPRWGTTPLDRIRYDDVAQWLADLSAGRTATGRKLSARSVRKAYVVLSSVLGYAVKSQRLSHNPVVDIPLPRAAEAEHVYLDVVQVEALAESAGSYGLFIRLLSYTGLRWGEASALTVGRVDLDARRAHVVQAYVDEKGVLHLDTPKNHERRSVPLPRFLLAELAAHINGRTPDQLLFTAPQGGPLRISNFRSRFFDRAVRAAELGHLHLTPHKLRHSAASLAIASGADVNVIQTMLGHKSATLTLDVYGHLFPDRLDEVSEKMDERRTRLLAKARALATVTSPKAQPAGKPASPPGRKALTR